MNKFFWFKVHRAEGDGEGGGGGGSGELNWRDGLSDELKGNASLANFPDINALAKSFVDTKAMQGASIRIPGEDASDEIRAEFANKLIDKVPNLMFKPDFDDPKKNGDFYKSIGVPAEAKEYEVPTVEGIDTSQIDDAQVTLMREISLNNNLTKAQFKGIMESTLKSQHDKSVESASKLNEGMQSLRQEWGLAFEDNIRLAVQAAKDTNAPPAFVEAMVNNQVNSDSIKWLHAVGKQLGSNPNNFGNQGDGGNDGVMTPVEAKAKIAEMMDNREHAYWDNHHPGHTDAINRMLELQKFANPNASTSMDALRAGGHS